MPSSGGWENAAFLCMHWMGQGPFWTPSFVRLEGLKLWRSKLVWKECRGPMGEGVGWYFLQPPKGAPLWWLKETVHLGFLAFGKVRGLGKPLTIFWGVRTWVLFQGRHVCWAVCVDLHVLSPQWSLYEEKFSVLLWLYTFLLLKLVINL